MSKREVISRKGYFSTSKLIDKMKNDLLDYKRGNNKEVSSVFEKDERDGEVSYETELSYWEYENNLKNMGYLKSDYTAAEVALDIEEAYKEYEEALNADNLSR